MKLKNLFSVLTEEQLQSLSKQERDLLYQLDQKLFPHFPEYVDLMSQKQGEVERCMERRKAQAQADAEYQKMLEASFK